MTRKDYEAIAKAVSNSMKWCSHQEIDATAIAILMPELIAALAKDNPRFDEPKFWTACGFLALKK